MKKIKKFAIVLLMIFSMSSASAVEYRSVGSDAEFNAYTFDGQLFLVLSFTDNEKNHLTNTTVVKFMLTDGTILRFDGTNEASSYEGNSSTVITNFGYVSSGFTSNNNSSKHFVVFRISQEELERLKIGVDKVTINTIPDVYKRTKWKGQKSFGSNLYNDFVNIYDEFTEEPNYWR